MNMDIPYFQIDAFTDTLFGGNPAGACFLEEWPADRTMRSIGAENNLSETAFLVPTGPGVYDLRWFTPEVEVALCGHATLASAYVIFRYVDKQLDAVAFDTKSGRLNVVKDGDRLTMDFPARPPSPCPLPDELSAGLGAIPVEVLRSRDYLALYESEEQIRQIRPDFPVSLNSIPPASSLQHLVKLLILYRAFLHRGSESWKIRSPDRPIVH